MRSFILLITLITPYITRSQNQGISSKKVVIILVDGIPTDLLYKTSTPVLDAIAKEGAFSEAYVGGRKLHVTESPTISAVGYNSMLTGTWAHKHNVYGNAIRNPNYHYPTIFRLLKNAYPNKKIAIYSTWLDNRTKLLGEGLDATQRLKVDFHFDGLELDKKNYPHDPEKKYLKRIDAEVARKAANHIWKTGPDLSWVYLEHSDDVGHMYGDGPQLRGTIAYEDALIGLIWDAVKLRAKNTGEDWLVIVTTDHGRDPKNAQNHGGQSYRERSTWVVLSQPKTNRYFKNNKVAIVDIVPTIADFMNISIPTETAYEMDGVSLIQPLDAFELTGTCYNRKYLHLKWFTEQPQKILRQGFTPSRLKQKNTSSPKTKSSVAKVLISYTNEFAKGGKDDYEVLGEVALAQKEFTTKIRPKNKAKYAKIVLETSNHTIATWVKLDNE